MYDDFFLYAKNRKTRGESAKNSPSFEVELPNGHKMKCKVAQSGSKALMSDPNKDLGKWILRDVLKVKEGTLVTIDILNELGIDSVRITKKDDKNYLLDFVEVDTYMKFEEDNN